MNILKQLTARYLVVAHFDGKTAKHYAKDWRDALEWMECYPPDTAMEVYERFLGITAAYAIAERWMTPIQTDRMPDGIWIEA